MDITRLERGKSPDKLRIHEDLHEEEGYGFSRHSSWDEVPGSWSGA